MVGALLLTDALIPGVAGLQRCALSLRAGLIDEISAPDDTVAHSAAARLSAAGCTVLPGFVDLHVHGGAGYDTMDATPAALAGMARFQAEHGVTAFLPTTMTAAAADTLQAVAAVAAAHALAPPGAQILGIHLEGPFVSPRHPGAQPLQHIRPPDLLELQALIQAGPVRMLTLAPELPGAAALMAWAQTHGVALVMGHTDASYEQAVSAVEAGVCQATHTYNAMTGLHHRRPGTLGAVLSDDRVYAQLIADNVHVHPAAVKILARCKGIGRTVLITDAIRAAGLPPGRYELGGQPVIVRDGACRLEDGTLAGSLLTMEKALANLMAASGLSLAEAWPASSLTPLAALGLDHDRGRLEPGYRADLVLLDAQLEVVATLVGGQLAYLREPQRLQRQL